MRKPLSLAFVAGVASSCTLAFPVDSLTRDAGSAEDGGGATPGAGAASADASADAADGGVVASPCARARHLFCDDFDRAGPPEAGWSAVEATGGPVTLVTTRAVSAPGALAVSLEARAASAATPTFSQLKLDRPLAGTTVAIAFHVFVPRPSFADGDGSIGLGCFSIRSGGARRTVCVAVGPAGASFGDVAGDPLPFDAWVPITIALGTSGEVTGTIGGSRRAAAPQAVADGAPEGIFVGLGLYGFNQPTPAAAAFYDDLTVDFL